MLWPKISIVTPNYNGGTYLEDTIKSVVEQGYPNLEYIIIDGGSTDNSLEIIRKYEKHISYWCSEPDEGMYYALQKGFDKSTGDIMAWLNSDDLYHPKCLFSVGEVFLKFANVKWLMGYPTAIDGLGRTFVPKNSPRSWYSLRYSFGDIGTIQQESVFWHRTLWNQSGLHISTKYRYAGDMELWSRFFSHEKLFITNCLLGGFRRTHSNEQLSIKFSSKYREEAKQIIKDHPKDKKDGRFLILKKLVNSFIRVINKVKVLNAAKVELIFFRKFFGIPNPVIFDEIDGEFRLRRY